MLIQVLFLALSITLTLLFFLYGFNHYYLLNAARKYKSPALPDRFLPRPSVAIHLPVYNERYVVRRLVAACAAMAETYGSDQVNIQILDDSSDDTVLEIDQVVAEYSNKGLRIGVMRRVNRVGFKAGALQAALEKTEEEFIVIFDADFIPPTDFLLRILPYFVENERLGIIQSRWTHLNRDFNILTRAVALGIDVHFLIEQTGRFAAGCFQNFNGSGGVLRKKALLEAGGWQADTLAEDLDLSYRLQNLGYQVLYLRDLQSPGEVPPTLPSFIKQQGRWACGSLRTARKILPSLLRNHNLGRKQRLEAFIHLTGYVVHPLIFLSYLLVCSITLYGISSNSFNYANFPILFGGPIGIAQFTPIAVLLFSTWGLLLVMIILCTLAPWISMVVALKKQKLSVFRNLPSLIVAFLIGYGVSLSNTIEAGKALLSNRIWEFTRTPKYANLQTGGEWKKSRYQIPLDFVWILELAAICLGGITIGFAARHSNLGVILILIPYIAAYTFVFSLTIIQSRKTKAS